MTDWLEQYSAALDVRDAREQAHKPYIDAYTKLADRTASSLATTAPPPAPPTDTSSPIPRTSTPSKGTSTIPPPTDTDLLTTLRYDLTTTQKARSTLQTQLSTLQTNLTTLQTTQKTSLSQITLLQKQKADLERRLGDKEGEIRGKANLVENAQDEMVALQLQLNMAEQKREAAETENKQLVERWMKRMGEEAERVNRDSKWE